jgi:hypothetical protein
MGNGYSSIAVKGFVAQFTAHVLHNFQAQARALSRATV